MHRHFFESLEREIDYQYEFEKLEQLIVKEEIWGVVSVSPNQKGYTNESINEFIERNFRKWDNRKRYISFKELREHLGFGFSLNNGRYTFANNITISRYFLYCEMILNMLRIFPPDAKFNNQVQVVLNTIKTTVEESGFEIRTLDEEILIVEKNAVAFEVADKAPDIADIIIEYNHYLLKGDLQRKKEILKQIGDSLEPRRKELESINKSMTSDFFLVLNKINIRHNNVDPADKSNYVEAFATAAENVQEGWYDLIYEQALALFVLLNQPARTESIEAFKHMLC